MTTKTIILIFCTLTVFFSCGPRTGIHDEPTEEIISVPEDTSARHLAEVKLERSLEKGDKLFKQNCAVCHFSHSDKYIIGPGLKGVFDRIPDSSDVWFINYTLNNVKVFNSGDRYAKKIRTENQDKEMTVFEGQLTEADIKEIIKFLKHPRKLIGCVQYEN